MYTLFLK